MRSLSFVSFVYPTSLTGTRYSQGAEQGSLLVFHTFSYVIIEEGQGAFGENMVGNKDGKLRPFG